MTNTLFKRTAAAGLLALMLTGSVFAGQPWKVATEGTFPPFEFYDSKTGEIQGFEVDLVKEMAKVMDKDLTIVTLGFDAILPAVLSGTVDTGAAGFSITPTRQQRVLFTDPFYTSGLTIVTKKGDDSIKGFADLKGKRISVQLGTTSASAAQKIEGAQVTTFNSAGDAILNMLAGNADAVINDKPVTDYILSQNAQLASQTTHLPEMATADVFAMIASKKNPKLVEEMNAALKILKENGTFNELHIKWFGKPAE